MISDLFSPNFHGDSNGIGASAANNQINVQIEELSCMARAITHN